eukprot:scaffold10191_cov108-Isochrysis_galbana.AAC.10
MRVPSSALRSSYSMTSAESTPRAGRRGRRSPRAKRARVPCPRHRPTHRSSPPLTRPSRRVPLEDAAAPHSPQPAHPRPRRTRARLGPASQKRQIHQRDPQASHRQAPTSDHQPAAVLAAAPQTRRSELAPA